MPQSQLTSLRPNKYRVYKNTQFQTWWLLKLFSWWWPVFRSVHPYHTWNKALPPWLVVSGKLLFWPGCGLILCKCRVGPSARQWSAPDTNSTDRQPSQQSHTITSAGLPSRDHSTMPKITRSPDQTIIPPQYTSTLHWSHRRNYITLHYKTIYSGRSKKNCKVHLQLCLVSQSSVVATGKAGGV